MLESRIAELENSLKLLESSKEPKCPLCGAPLDAEKKDRIITNLRGQLEKSKLKISIIKEKLRERKEELEKLRERKEELKVKESHLERIRNSLKDIINTLEPLEKKRRSIKERLILLNSSIEELERKYDNSLKRLQELEKAESIVNSYDISLLNNPKKSLELMSKKISLMENRTEDLTSKVNYIKEELKTLCNVSSLEQALNLIEESIEKSLLKEELEDKKRFLERKIMSINVLLDEKRSELKKINGQLEKLRRKEKGLINLEKEYLLKSEEFKKVLEKLSRLKQDVLHLNDMIDETQESIKNLEESKFKLEVLSYIREIIFERVPKLLFLEYLAKLEDLMSDILSKFELNYTAVSIRVENNIISIMAIGRDGVPVPLGSLSGGERTAIALAFVLALNILLARRTGFLILDEPTNNLDEERRRILVDILKVFKGGERIPQLIVVSHDRDVIEAADAVFEVNRGPLGSTLRPLKEQQIEIR